MVKFIFMKSKITFIVLILFCLSFSVFAQDNTSSSPQETYQPNLRGSLLVGVGVNILQDAPNDFKISPFRSKSVNIYYLYEIPLGDSKFSFNPGFGLGLEKYQFRNNTILTYRNEVDEFESTEPILIMDTVSNVLGGRYPYSKNRLAANYIDIPLEFSFATNRTNPKAGLLLALGGKIGYLYSAHTKLKYEAFGESQIEKHKRSWDLNRFRYSAHARIGYGGFNLYFEYQLSDLFDNKFGGPLHRTLRNKGDFDAPFREFPGVKNFRAGIAVDLF